MLQQREPLEIQTLTTILLDIRGYPPLAFHVACLARVFYMNVGTFPIPNVIQSVILTYFAHSFCCDLAQYEAQQGEYELSIYYISHDDSF
jgi:hypothetical protein